MKETRPPQGNRALENVSLVGDRFDNSKDIRKAFMTGPSTAATHGMRAGTEAIWTGKSSRRRRKNDRAPELHDGPRMAGLSPRP